MLLRYFITLAFAHVAIAADVNAQSYDLAHQWANVLNNDLPSGSFINGRSIVHDALGNVYVTGSFTASGVVAQIVCP